MLNITRGGAMTKGKEAVDHPYVYTTVSSQNNDASAIPIEPSLVGAGYYLDSFLSLCEIQPPIFYTSICPEIMLEFEFMPGDVLLTSTDSTMLAAVGADVNNNPT